MKKRIVIGGIAGGLGTQVKLRLGDKYHIVGLGRSARDPDPLLEQYKVVDLTSLDEVKAIAAELERGGGVDAVINCAGSVHNSPLWLMSEEEWRRTLDDNLTSCFALLSAFSPSMRRRGTGRFIFLSSVVRRKGSFGASHYAAAKGGVEALTRSSSLELGPSGITVNAIAPGYMNTGLISAVPEKKLSQIIESIPQRRLGPGNQVAAMVEYLLSEDASYISGQVIGIDGGL